MSIIAYAAYSKNEKTRRISSSGGIFSELSEFILSNDGYISGAAFDDDFKSVSHIVINDIEELSKLTTSKYLQSRFLVHKDIENLLKIGKKVLCCGTPCQIAGLKSFLKTDYENLFTVDLICHGVPVQKIWKKYLNWQEHKYGENVTFVNFRSKDTGWDNYSLYLKFKSGKEYKKVFYNDPYMQLYLSDICLSKGCYNCRFKGNNRYSDITIGDFWGIKDVKPELYDNKGISIVTLNTEKGVTLFNSIKDNFVVQEVNESLAFEHNLCAIQSVFKPKEYDDFMKDIEVLPFEKLAKKYLPKVLLKQHLKRYRIVKSVIRFKHKIAKL